MRLMKRAIIQLICLLIFFGSMLVAFVLPPVQPDPHSPAIFGVVGALSIIAIAIIEVANSLDNHE